MDITELRLELDKVDGKLIELLEKRMDLCKQIGEEKKKLSKPVYDKAREEEKLENVRISTQNVEYADALSGIFTSIMDESKKLQNKVM